MDKLEEYLDRVCRGIAGPRALRQHVRRELREHLLDAAAEHKKAGLPEEPAIEQALADFGAPDDVRSELEATHGQRVMALVIDKALDWKEKTMRAKWLWATWAHLALACTILLEVLFLAGAGLFLVPKVMKIMQDTGFHWEGVAWAPAFFGRLFWALDNALWVALLVAAVWAMFEWRVRSDNKPLMRLSAILTAALVLMVGVALTTAGMVVPLVLLTPELMRRAGL